jgi:hypothetical protein
VIGMRNLGMVTCSTSLRQPGRGHKKRPRTNHGSLAAAFYAEVSEMGWLVGYFLRGYERRYTNDGTRHAASKACNADE